MSQPEPSLTMTVKEAASHLGINVKTLYEAINAGQFPARKLGRRIIIGRQALLDWLSSNEGVLPQRKRRR